MLRSFARLTQRELARRSHVSKPTISAYERGLQEIGPSTLRRLLEALELPSRAWCETVSFVERLEYLASRHGRPVARATDLQSLQREADALAETFGRDRERQTAGLLDFALEAMAHLGGEGRD
jgi:transcriptional regulator with XRE-family HTH domain